MALNTSGTITTVAYDTRTVVDRAYGALGLTPQQITGEKIQIALDLLSLVLTDLVNTSSPLWCLQKVLVTLVNGVRSYPMLPGTNDIQSAYYRTVSNVTPAVFTNTPTAYTWDFGLNPQGANNDTQVTSASINWTGAAVPVLFQSSEDQVNWTTVYTSDLTNSSGSGLIWYDMSNTQAMRYWQVIPATTYNNAPVNYGGAPNTLSITLAQLYNTPSDINMYRMNRDQYFDLPDKTFPGRPLQFWLNRQLTPSMDIWPAPGPNEALNLIAVRRQRLIQDVGTLQQAIEVPTRWFYTIIFGLADALAFTTPEAKPDRIQMVQVRYQQMLKVTWTEERDKSPFVMQFGIRPYTR